MSIINSQRHVFPAAGGGGWSYTVYTDSFSGAAGTTHDYTMPASGIASGDLVIMLYGNEDNGNLSTLGGNTTTYDTTHEFTNGAAPGIQVFMGSFNTADLSATYTFTHAASANVTALLFVIVIPAAAWADTGTITDDVQKSIEFYTSGSQYLPMSTGSLVSLNAVTSAVAGTSRPIPRTYNAHVTFDVVTTGISGDTVLVEQSTTGAFSGEETTVATITTNTTTAVSNTSADLLYFRCRVSAYSAGTITATMNWSSCDLTPGSSKNYLQMVLYMGRDDPRTNVSPPDQLSDVTFVSNGGGVNAEVHGGIGFRVIETGSLVTIGSDDWEINFANWCIGGFLLIHPA